MFSSFKRSRPLLIATATGWNAELFPRVLAHFIKHIGWSKEKPALLPMDNHNSHCSLEVVDLARENDLTSVTFPPHCSHRLQPLDITDEEEQIPEDTLQQPDWAEASTAALPEDIMTLPRLAMNASKTGRKRKLGSARVLTSTTEKERLPKRKI